ncbi:hypothetical protein PUN28_019564 [Cardiocondyla obscurior]|uniref:Uncharacterized protein n=1 Tax=Cardiocondyla obscurior TaxID=286306 RepID=A0AAW2E962_9HYME
MCKSHMNMILSFDICDFSRIFLPLIRWKSFRKREPGFTAAQDITDTGSSPTKATSVNNDRRACVEYSAIGCFTLEPTSLKFTSLRDSTTLIFPMYRRIRRVLVSPLPPVLFLPFSPRLSGDRQPTATAQSQVVYHYRRIYYDYYTDYYTIAIIDTTDTADITNVTTYTITLRLDCVSGRHESTSVL